MPTYHIVYVCARGRLMQTSFDRSPPDARVLERGKRSGALFAVRFWPSRKGWRICDMRRAQCFRAYTGFDKWANYAWSNKVYPSESAAVMVALANLSYP